MKRDRAAPGWSGDATFHDVQAREDANRDDWMRAEGLSVLRVTNEDMMSRMNEVLSLISDRVRSLCQLPLARGPGQGAGG